MSLRSAGCPALPPLAFPHDGRIVADWLALRARGEAE